MKQILNLTTSLLAIALLALFFTINWDSLLYWVEYIQNTVGPTGIFLVLLSAYLITLLIENIIMFFRSEPINVCIKKTADGRTVHSIDDSENTDLVLYEQHLENVRGTALLATALGLAGTFFGIGDFFVDGKADVNALTEIIVSTLVGVSIWIASTAITLILERLKNQRLAIAINQKKQRYLNKMQENGYA